MVDLLLGFREPAHGLPLQNELVGVVDQTVQDGIGDGWVSDSGVPVVNGQLADDYSGTCLAARQ